MRIELRKTAMVGLAAAGLSIATAAQAGNFMAFNRAFGVGSDFGTPTDGPATWTGTAGIMGSAPASFSLNAFTALWTTSIVNPTPPTAAGILASTQIITVSGPLSPGTFMAGGGPGAFVFNPPPDPTFGTRIGTAQVIPGSNQFGAAIGHSFKFLSRLSLNFGFAIFQGTYPLSEVQGLTTAPGATKPTQSFTGTFANTASPASNTQVFLRANFWPWTTGVAIGKDNGGIRNTTVTITGYDNRTPNGQTGTVQLVAPVLFSAFNAGAFGVNHLSGVNVLTYQFAPEPGNTALLGAGIGGLLLLGGLDRRRRVSTKGSRARA